MVFQSLFYHVRSDCKYTYENNNSAQCFLVTTKPLRIMAAKPDAGICSFSMIISTPGLLRDRTSLGNTTLIVCFLLFCPSPPGVALQSQSSTRNNFPYRKNGGKHIFRHDTALWRFQYERRLERYCQLIKHRARRKTELWTILVSLMGPGEVFWQNC